MVCGGVRKRATRRKIQETRRKHIMEQASEHALSFGCVTHLCVQNIIEQIIVKNEQ
jgi:hypothetical protein